MIIKLPKIKSWSPWKVRCECEKCGKNLYIIGRNHKDGTKWIEGTCDRGHLYRNFEIDFLQPSNPFYNLIYKTPEDEYNRKKRVAEIEEEQRKAELEKKYYYKYRGNNPGSVIKADEKRAIEKEVLMGE